MKQNVLSLMRIQLRSLSNYLLNELESAAYIKKTEEIKEVKEKVIDNDIIKEAINNKVDTDEGDIFMFGVLSTNIMEELTNERKTIGYDEADSKSLAISTNVTLLDKQDSEADIPKPEECKEIKEKVIDYDVVEQNNLTQTEDALQGNRKSTVLNANNFDSETSITMGIARVPSFLQPEKRRTVIFGKDNYNMSMKLPISAELITDETELLYTTKTSSSNLTKQNRAANPQSDIIKLQAITTSSKQITASVSEKHHLKDPLYCLPTYVNAQKANNSKVASPNTQKSLAIIPVSTIVVPVYSKDIDKLQAKLTSSKTDRNIEKVSGGDDDSVIQTALEETKESLTNISDQSLQRGTSDKSLMASLELDPPSAVMSQHVADNTSTGRMFYIIKDGEVATQIGRKMDNEAKRANSKEEEQVVHLQRQLSELSKSFKIDKKYELVNIKQQSDNASSRDNDTQDLLDLISNFTDSVICEDNFQPVVIKVQDQGETKKHKRRSVAPNRRPIALSREDLFSNTDESIRETTHNCEEKSSSLKTARLRTAFGETSNMNETKGEVIPTFSKNVSNGIKELMLDLVKPMSNDNMPVETVLIDNKCLRGEDKFSPLKKTAFGETSYMNETKEEVIPTYCKNVSDGIKEIMLDLVKPVSNVNIVEIGLIDSGITQIPSTPNAQIQGNSDTSSQKEENTLKPKLSAVLVFDHLNPLNNIWLSPHYSKNACNYNPRQTDQTLCGSVKLLKKNCDGNNYDAETFTTTQFTIMPEPNTMRDDTFLYRNRARFGKKDDQSSSQSTSAASGCIPVDQSVDAMSMHSSNDKVNTIIEMGNNKELLQTSLSPAVVEDSSEDANRAFTTDNSKKQTKQEIKFSIPTVFNTKGQAANIDSSATQDTSTPNAQIQANLATSSHKDENTMKPKLSAVLVFDHLNPLNNICFSPNYSDGYNYDPRQTDTETLSGSEKLFKIISQGNNDCLTPVDNILPSRTDETPYSTLMCDLRKTIHTLFAYTNSFNKMSRGDYGLEKDFTITQNTMVPGSNTHTLVNEKSEIVSCVRHYNNNKIGHLKYRSKSLRSPRMQSQAAKIDRIARISSGDQFYSKKSCVNSVTKGKKQIYIPSTGKYRRKKPILKPIKKIIRPRSPKPHKLRTELYTRRMAPVKDVTETINRDTQSSSICEKKSPGTKETSVLSVDKPCPPAVLVFDLHNPLNNILLAPTYFMDGNKYNPRHTDETVCGSACLFSKISEGNHYEVETMTTTLYTRVPESNTMQDDMYIYQKGDCFKFASSTSGTFSVKESIDAHSTPLRDAEVNTLIAMRGNKELLESSSLLRLVNNETGNRILASDKNKHSNHTIKILRSLPVNIKGQVANTAYVGELSESKSLEEQIYIPSNGKDKQYILSMELSKPLKQTLELPTRDDFTQYMAPEKDVTENNNQNAYLSKICERESPRTKETKSGQTIIVQKLSTVYHNVETDLKHNNNFNTEIKLYDPNQQNDSCFVFSEASFTSSKNLNAMRDIDSTDCHRELIFETSCNESDNSSGIHADVDDKINMLPFMGPECEWETGSAADKWSFGLLKGHLKLTTRLAPRS